MSEVSDEDHGCCEDEAGKREGRCRFVSSGELVASGNITERALNDPEARLVDRAAVLNSILQRQALRREARLPPLNIRTEYDRAVEQALWRAHFEEHGETVRAQVLAELRVKHGPQFGQSVGGLWAVRLLTDRRLREMFELTADRR